MEALVPIIWALAALAAVSMVLAGFCVVSVIRQSRQIREADAQTLREAMGYIKAGTIVEKVQADHTDRRLQAMEKAAQEAADAPPAMKIMPNTSRSTAVREMNEKIQKQYGPDFEVML